MQSHQPQTKLAFKLLIGITSSALGKTVLPNYVLRRTIHESHVAQAEEKGVIGITTWLEFQDIDFIVAPQSPRRRRPCGDESAKKRSI